MLGLKLPTDPRWVNIVEKNIEEILTDLDAKPVKVHGSGRTDQGVHARGQVAHCDLRREWEPQRLRIVLNAKLPADIRVERVALVKNTFHARRSASGKEYRYFRK